MTATTTQSPRRPRGARPRRSLVKTFGRVVGLDGVDLDLYPGEVLAIIGDNGAGKSTLIKCLTGAMIPDAGEISLDGEPVSFKRPQDAQHAGIETVYQTLAVAPALDIASNLFLGRERRRRGRSGSVLRMLDHKGMREDAAQGDVGPRASGPCRTWARPSRPCRAASARPSRWPAPRRSPTKLIVLDEPTAALGVRETNQVLRMIERVRENGMPVILISHNMPHVFEVADRIHIQRLGRCAGAWSPRRRTR